MFLADSDTHACDSKVLQCSGLPSKDTGSSLVYIDTCVQIQLSLTFYLTVASYNGFHYLTQIMID